MLEKIENILSSASSKIKAVKDLAQLGDIRVKYLGKNGEITALLKSLKNYPSQERPTAGKYINELRQKVEKLILDTENELSRIQKERKLKEEEIDVTLSKASLMRGGLHPITLAKNELVNAFIGLGYDVQEGPEIETDFYNFQQLNVPKDHPARDMQDTFYITDHILLRTQTSSVQARTMEVSKPPIRMICPGKVYRSDDDATHSPMFHQMEGLVVDKGIDICDLKGSLDEIAKSFFGKGIRTRLRPSYFPFTEPSVELDVSCFNCNGNGCRLCKGTGWIEVLGAGIVNPVVLEYSGIDSKVYSGFAFGVGIERCAMLKYGIPDMRFLFENDIRFLRQYK
ncbi:MAG: phenylalanine--tRNA ligase subunit alpha [Clostridiales bacterium]|nr:phenylalanine--tRNA ligase subunit alpha [Clostridiales bacterium]